MMMRARKSLRRLPWRHIISVVVVSFGLVLVYVAVDRWAGRSAAVAARLAATERMRANAGLFDSELQKYRLLPLVLAESSDVISLLKARDPAMVRQLNAKLRLLAEHTGVAVLYVIDARGVTLAASNAELPSSFVGESFAYRPYFRQAMAGQNAEYFALGALSGRPGLFFARPVGNGTGVVVAKIAFDRLEAEWAKQPGATLIRDRYGVITVASDKRWVIHASRPIPAIAHQEAQRTRQFGPALPPALPFILPSPKPNGGNEGEIVQLAPGRRYAIASQPVAITGWTLSSLEPLDTALRTARTRAQVIGLLAALILVISFGLLVRSIERRRLLVASREILEQEVTRQTAELRAANEQLVAEVAEREQTSQRLRTARDELAQANRLGSIGQITAGVAHEITQPVAAIQTFAENTKILVSQSDPQEAQRNLDLIVSLTARIGRIINELRAFARRDPPPVERLRVVDALDGALLLIGDRLRADHVALKVVAASADSVMVMADRVRLEQVLINLLQNSLDAMAEVGQRQIEVRIHGGAADAQVRITVDDSGVGIPAALRPTLFEPFVTGKKNGLGLGLGIAQDIIRQFGGELQLGESILGGTAFLISLSKS